MKGGGTGVTLLVLCCFSVIIIIGIFYGVKEIFGCKPDDWVICVGSSAAREAAGSKSYPSDLTIVGIIDHWDPETQQQVSGGAK